MRIPTLHYSFPTDILEVGAPLNVEEQADITDMLSTRRIFTRIGKDDIAMACTEEIAATRRSAFHRFSPNIVETIDDKKDWPVWRNYLPNTHALRFSPQFKASDFNGLFAPDELKQKMRPYQTCFANLEVRWRSFPTKECALFGKMPDSGAVVLLARWADAGARLATVEEMASIAAARAKLASPLDAGMRGFIVGMVLWFAVTAILRAMGYRFDIEWDPRIFLSIMFGLVVFSTLFGSVLALLRNVRISASIKNEFGWAL